MPAVAQPGPNEITLRLRTHPSACADARHAIRDLCLNSPLHHISGDAQLLTSELVSNAVRAAISEVTLTAVRDSTGLTVTVSDDGVARQDVPDGGALPDRDSEHGRGLVLVDRLSEQWGTSQDDAVHRVWFRILR